MPLQSEDLVSLYLSGQSITTNAGLGFRGYDDHGEPCWDLVDNADIWKVEVATLFSFTAAFKRPLLKFII